MSERIGNRDHLVMVVNDVETACAFFQQVLGLAIITFADRRKALKIAEQKNRNIRIMSC